MDSWDSCSLDEVQRLELAKLDNLFDFFDNKSVNVDNPRKLSNEKAVTLNFIRADSFVNENFVSKKKLLLDTEITCKTYLDSIDELLQTLSSLSVSYYDVTGRTNILMASCEDLLDQQVIPAYFTILVLDLILISYSKNYNRLLMP